MWSQTKGFDVRLVITLETFLRAINHCEKDKWRWLRLQAVQYFPKPGAGARQVQGLAQLINAETAGNKHESRETNDFHNTGVIRQTPNTKRWFDAFVT